MIQPPAYFEEIRREAAELWETLSQQPKLAGAWHQLFKQVQNPRHVISELLQNADDAGATHASVTIDDGVFIFTHNGQDFEPATFASLCNFAYSNKRTLHTIGFRGIGFKSIFSLGDVVELETPTLSVAFDHRRFTEPVWIGKRRAADGQTSFRVKIKDAHRRSEIAKSIRIWCESPSSLLFFRSLRNLRLGDSHVEWKTNGAGPAGQSEWLALNSPNSDAVLLIRSRPEQFPEEAIREIREERMVDTDDSPLPPCSVELVVGIEGELFVVLPTGVKTQLPFACNAPFVQDPARLKIKNPEISPTNRWLLRRLGELAAKAMLDWLRTATLTTQERSRAYSLLTRFRPEDSSLEGSCESIVADAFHDLVVHRELLLTESGKLARSNECIAVPDWLNQVWSSEQTSKFFDEDKRPLFCQEVNRDARRRLVDAEYLEELPAESILVILQENHLPRPSSWRQLLILWDAVAPALSKGRYSWEKSWTDVRIVPVQGHECLHSASEVVRLSEKRLLRADSDWEFLSQFLRVLNVNWPRYIAEQRRVADKSQNIGLAGQVQSAEKLLSVLSLTESSDAGLILERVAESFFGDEDDDRERSDCIRLAHIAAALGADAPQNFKFITADDQLTALSRYWLTADIRWDLREFVTDEWYDNYVIHEDYWQRFESCSREDWEQWITTGRSGLLQFPPIELQKDRIWGVDSLRERVEQRGGQVGQLPYKSHEFLFEDQDFDKNLWAHWSSLAESDSAFWWKLVKRICEQPVKFWSESLSATVSQIATNGWQKTIDTGDLIPAWILKLRDLPCLQDTWGGLHHPAELFRRTAETESLFDIEPFVRAEIDTEALRPLLIALGVRDKATDPTRLLERLQALSTLSEPRVDEVLKWCRRLDALASKCPTEDFERLRQAFHEQQLILTADGSWARVSEVFLGSGDSEVPGAPVIHLELR
ncbi:MAG: sacsin N-terminal ATP-binding-like domain-containing protein, partial [Thermomicrobiales bacterium]